MISCCRSQIYSRDLQGNPCSYSCTPACLKCKLVAFEEIKHDSQKVVKNQAISIHEIMLQSMTTG